MFFFAKKKKYKKRKKERKRKAGERNNGEMKNQRKRGEIRVLGEFVIRREYLNRMILRLCRQARRAFTRLVIREHKGAYVISGRRG